MQSKAKISQVKDEPVLYKEKGGCVHGETDKNTETKIHYWTKNIAQKGVCLAIMYKIHGSMLSMHNSETLSPLADLPKLTKQIIIVDWGESSVSKMLAQASKKI